MTIGLFAETGGEFEYLHALAIRVYAPAPFQAGVFRIGIFEGPSDFRSYGASRRTLADTRQMNTACQAGKMSFQPD